MSGRQGRGPELNRSSNRRQLIQDAKQCPRCWTSARDSSMPTGVAESVIAKAGVGVIQRVAPSGIARLRAWWHGKKVLVIGQGRAGKTTFIRYMRYGILHDAGDSLKTVEISTIARFTLLVGKENPLSIAISSATDTPGQIGATEHARIAFKRRPHAIIIVADLTTPLEGEPDRSSVEWIKEFFIHYSNLWRKTGRTNHRLNVIMVLLNKKDLATNDQIEQCKLKIRDATAAHLGEFAKGAMTNPVEIIPVCSVTNTDTPPSKSLDFAITQLAMGLQ